MKSVKSSNWVSSPIWHEISTWKNKENFSKTEFVNLVSEQCTNLIKGLERYYEEARENKRVYQYRSAYETSSGKEDIADKFHITENNYFTFNLVRACCNTAVNKIAKVTPKVTFLTKEAGTADIQTAKKLDSWVFKKFKKMKLYKECSKAFLDACVGGIGVVKLFLDEKEPYFKKINSDDFFFNYPYNGPTVPDIAGEKKQFSSYELCEMFPDHSKEIIDNHNIDPSITVFEIYKEYKRHVIFTDKLILLDEKWENELPYELIKWTEATEGVVGTALAKELYYPQQTITYVLNKILTSVRLFAVPRAFLQKGADPTADGIGNTVGEIIEYNKGETPPIFQTPPVMHPQVFDFLMMVWDKGFEQSGLSKAQAAGQMPLGLQQASGAALRSYSQMTNERFQLIRTDYENVFVNLAKKLVKSVKDSSLPQGITRKDVNAAMENVTIFSSNILPETPAGRMAMVSDLYSSGLITKEQSLYLIDSKDTDKLLSSETKRIQAIEIELERTIKLNKMPDLTSVASLGIEVYLDKARKKYAEIIVEKGNEAKELEILNEFISVVQEKLQSQIQAAQLANQGGEGQGQGEPLNVGAYS